MGVSKGSRGPRLVCLCVSLLSLAACGGGGGGSDSPAPLPNTPPVAAAGDDQTVFKGELVQLNAAASSDADGQTLTYSWTHKSGPAITLTNSSTADASFTAPSISGVVVLELSVNDGRSSATDEVSITVQNRVPTARAPEDFQVALGASVTLSAPDSFDPDSDALTFTWTQTFGPTVTLTPASDGSVTFQAPAISRLLRFSVVASDGELESNEDSIVVAVGSATTQIPFADAGLDVIVPRNQDVSFWGWGYGSIGSPLTFSWAQVGGPSVTLNAANTPNPSFRSPSTPATLEFELIVSNGVFASLPSRVVIEVQNYPPYVFAELTPATVRTLDNVIANLTMTDADGDDLSAEYTWRKNGTVVAGITSPTFPHEQQAKGDVLELTVAANDGLETTTATFTANVEDTPPTYQASPPTQIGHGDTLSFQVTGTDLDGDPVGNYNLLHGPAGMSVDAAGTVTWVARLPMFGAALDVNYAVAATGHPNAFAGTVTVRDSTRRQLARRTGVEIPRDDGGLVIVDLDADGDVEILVASYDAVQEFAWNGSDYELQWAFPYHLQNRDAIAVAAADVEGNAQQEIFIGAGNRVLRLDSVSREVSAELALDTGDVCKRIDIGDLDASGGLEVVCLVSGPYSSPARVVVIDPVSMQVLWETFEFGGSSSQVAGLAIGNVDADAALEIVTGPGYVFDGATRNSEWAYGPGFGVDVDTGDLTGDGIEEIVAMQNWSNTRIFDAVMRTPIAEVAANIGGTDTILVENIEGSAAAEIIIADAQGGNVIAYRYDTATAAAVELFRISTQGSGVSAIGVGDVDGDSSLEFVWGAGSGSSGEDTLVVVGRSPAAAVEWINGDPAQLDGSFYGGMPVTTAMGESRFMFSTARTDSGYGGARLIAIDPATMSMTLSSEVGSNWSGVFALDAADYDGDAIEEVLIGTSDLYTGYFAAYDFAADSEEWRSPTDVGVAQAMTHADFTGDGRPDLVAVANQHVHVFDVANSNLVWRSVSFTQYGIDVAVANVAGDATPEIIAATNDRITIYRRHTTPAFVESTSVALPGLTDLLVADTDGDAQVEIYAVAGQFSSSSTIHKFSTSLQPITTFNTGAEVRSLHLEDLPTTHRNLVIGTDSRYLDDVPPTLMAVDPSSGAEVWRAPSVVAPVTRNSLFYSDLDSDGNHQISFAAGSSAYVTQ